MSAVFKSITVSADQVFEAMRKFDDKYADSGDYDHWLSKSNDKYAVRNDGRLYPVKHLLSEATGVEVSRFSGGDQANGIFRSLGFEVVPKTTDN